MKTVQPTSVQQKTACLTSEMITLTHVALNTAVDSQYMY